MADSLPWLATNRCVDILILLVPRLALAIAILPHQVTRYKILPHQVTRLSLEAVALVDGAVEYFLMMRCRK